MNLNLPAKRPHSRLGMAELADELENVAQAFRAAGTDAGQVGEWKRRYREEGFAGLHDLPKRPVGRPPLLTPELANRILELALEDPGNGCQRISRLLDAEGAPLSHVSVQSVLNKHGIGSRTARIEEVERRVLDGSLPLTKQREEWIESINSSFAERHRDPRRPCQTWNLATITASRIQGLTRVTFHVAVDPWNLNAFAIAGTDPQPDWSVALLHNDVLPHAANHGLAIHSIRTPSSATYCGRKYHHFGLYLGLNDLPHEFVDSLDGHTRRFLGWLREDFIGKRRRRNYPHLETLQADLDEWLDAYNSSHAWKGWPNRETSPDERLRQWKQSPNSTRQAPVLIR